MKVTIDATELDEIVNGLKEDYALLHCAQALAESEASGESSLGATLSAALVHIVLDQADYIRRLDVARKWAKNSKEAET